MSTYSNRLQPALQNLLQRVVRFFHPRSSCTIGGLSENNIKCVVHDELWWKNRTTRYNIIAGFLPRHWLYEWFSQFHSCGTYSVLSRSPSITCVQRYITNFGDVNISVSSTHYFGGPVPRTPPPGLTAECRSVRGEHTNRCSFTLVSTCHAK